MTVKEDLVSIAHKTQHCSQPGGHYAPLFLSGHRIDRRSIIHSVYTQAVFNVGMGVVIRLFFYIVACSIDTTDETMALHRGAEPCVCLCINGTYEDA